MCLRGILGAITASLPKKNEKKDYNNVLLIKHLEHSLYSLMSIFTEAEQAKISSYPFAHTKKVRRGIQDLTVNELYNILSRNEEGARVTFLNFHITKSGKVALGEDDYANNIYDNLNDRTRKLVEDALVSKGGFNEAVSIHSSGLFIMFLLNRGTTKEPIWDKLDNILINVSTTGFKVKLDGEGNPAKGIVRVHNSNINQEIYEDYLHNPKLDNEALCACIDMIQRDLVASMTKLSETKGAVFFSEKEVPQHIIESRSLDLSNEAFASLYRRCSAKPLKGGGFEAVPHAKESEHFFNIRFPISKPLDQAGVDSYNKTYSDKTSTKIFKFKILGKQVALKNNKICLRHFNTDRIGKEGASNSILEFPISLSTHKSQLYDVDGKDYELHPYRRADETFAGVNNPAFTQFTKSRSQVINAVVHFRCFVGRDSMSINIDPVTFEPVYLVRLENARFALSEDCGDDGDVDIDEGTPAPRAATAGKRRVLPGEENIDEAPVRAPAKAVNNLAALGDDQEDTSQSLVEEEAPPTPITVRTSARRPRATQAVVSEEAE